MNTWILIVCSALLALCCLLDRACCQLSHKREELLDWCLDGLNHKTKPGPEDELHKQCQPWKQRSCCTQGVTRDVHISDMYNFTWNHCGSEQPMSLDCRRHFIQDLCFYECEPNLGPWMVKVNMKIRKERFFEVPLCASDCERWFNACRRDLTCVDNWVTKFKWADGKNYCPSSESCRPYEEVFKTAEQFCNNIWDHSWKYVPDTQSCMRLWFNDSAGSPNRQVAELRVDELLRKWNGQSPLACSAFLVISALLVVTIFSF